MFIPESDNIHEAVEKALNFCGKELRPIFKKENADEDDIKSCICATLGTCIEMIMQGKVKFLDKPIGGEPDEEPPQKVDLSDDESVEKACIAIASNYLDTLHKYADTEEEAKKLSLFILVSIAKAMGIEKSLVSKILMLELVN
ncbi:MAG: hypothetical protein J6T99_07145 [Oscillospiraceae bacterium]|nr:hypothetical protein [Oscillospiraceae bacterium]